MLRVMKMDDQSYMTGDLCHAPVYREKNNATDDDQHISYNLSLLYTCDINATQVFKQAIEEGFFYVVYIILIKGDRAWKATVGSAAKRFRHQLAIDVLHAGDAGRAARLKGKHCE